MYERERQGMIDKLVASGYLKSETVIEAMKKVERHLFVPENVKMHAYADQPLPVGEGQTISAPHMVAMMCELLKLEKGLKVLEIGAGTGYHACVVAEIIKGGKIYSVESKTRLVERARENITSAGCTGVELIEGDGTEGYEKEAPYDRVFVTAGAPGIPPPLIEQLKAGGRLLMPVGTRYVQSLVQADKTTSGDVKKRTLSGCAFVPLIGKHGW